MSRTNTRQCATSKKRVLDHAVSQINNHTDITAEYEQHKTGRKVTGFTFRFKSKAKAVSSDPKPLTSDQIRKYSGQLARLSELGSKAPVGASTEEYTSKIAAELKTSEGIKKYLPHLIKLGFKS